MKRVKLSFFLGLLFTISRANIARAESYNPISGDNVKTALGEVPIDINGLVGWFFGHMLGIIGGIALLLMISASLQILTSAGDPNKIKKGQEAFTSVVIGLIFILLSLFLLRFIGITVLHLPGLG